MFAILVAQLTAVVCLCGPATGPHQPADRLTPPTTTTQPPVTTGLWGQPFAPEGLSNCDEMTFYRRQWGLPDRFDAIGWRESNCRNEDGVRTSCCHGYWQLWINLHLRDQRIGWRYRDLCGVHSVYDVNSDEPLDKQRQACAAKQLYDVVGMSAWG